MSEGTEHRERELSDFYAVVDEVAEAQADNALEGTNENADEDLNENDQDKVLDQAAVDPKSPAGAPRSREEALMRYFLQHGGPAERAANNLEFELQQALNGGARASWEGRFNRELEGVTDPETREVLQAAYDHREHATAERHQEILNLRETMPTADWNRRAWEAEQLARHFGLTGNHAGDKSIIALGRFTPEYMGYLDTVHDLQQLFNAGRDDPAAQTGNTGFNLQNLVEHVEAELRSEESQLTPEKKEKAAALLGYLHDNSHVYEDSKALAGTEYQALIPTEQYRVVAPIDLDNQDEDYPFTHANLDHHLNTALPEFRALVEAAVADGKLNPVEGTALEQNCRVLENILQEIKYLVQGEVTLEEDEDSSDLVGEYLAVIHNLETYVSGQSDFDLEANGENVHFQRNYQVENKKELVTGDR